MDAGILLIRDLAVVMVVAGVIGWVCRRLGLSVVVGYLAAGVFIGPFTPPFAFVSDLDRVQTLAQVGLVFLIFTVGMNLSISRLQRLGPAVILAGCGKWPTPESASNRHGKFSPGSCLRPGAISECPTIRDFGMLRRIMMPLHRAMTAAICRSG